jgi:hypothetical protein
VRLAPHQEDMSSNLCQDRTWALSEDLGSGLLQKIDFPIEKVPKYRSFGELFTEVKGTFLKSVQKDGYFDTPFDLYKEKKVFIS